MRRETIYEKEEASPMRVSELPTIKIGDKVVISGNDFTINNTTYYGKSLDNTTPGPINSTTTTTRVASYDVTLQGVFQAKRIIAFQNAIATNPTETLSYMRVSYKDRKVVLSYTSVFFCGHPDALVAFQRDKDNRVIPLTIDKGTLSQDSGAYNKLAYLFYGDSSVQSISRIRKELEGLPSDVKVDVVTDTSKDSKEIASEKFMRDRLKEWGVSVDPGMSGNDLERLYTIEHQKRVPTKGSGKITPNPYVPLTQPIIAPQTQLPETGFRKYTSKILLVTLFGAGVIMYRRSIAARDGV